MVPSYIGNYSRLSSEREGFNSPWDRHNLIGEDFDVVLPAEIMTAAHKICVDKLIPNNISPHHDEIGHLPTARWYAEAINEAGLSVSGEDVVNAIITVTDWDTESTWPGHPGPAAVIQFLNGVK